MNERLRRPRWLHDDWRGWAVALILVLGMAVTFALVRTVVDANTARDRAIERRSHSFEVMILARSLGENLSQAEAALGRFVISGDKQLGVRFAREWASAGRQMDLLARMMGDNALQRSRVVALDRAYHARGRELATIASGAADLQPDRAIAAFYDARDSASLRRIDELLGQTMAAERLLLDARSIELDATVARSNRLAGFLLALGIALLAIGLFVGWHLLQAIAERRAAADEADAERARAAELEAAVAAATESLRAEQAERAAAEAQLGQAQKMEAIGQLTGGIAHDFNNMLAVVLGGIELARRHAATDPALARHLDLAAEGGQRAAALTRQLLAFARAEPVAPEAIDPPALIAGMTPLLDRTLGDAIRIETRDEAQGWCVWADRHQLENAILNLAVNARDAMEGRGTLTLTARAVKLGAAEVGGCSAGEHVAFAVTDSGHGMTPEIKARVFEPFFTTKPVGRGTGLGLSQVFGTVRRFGGEIAIESAPGEGTTVTLYLPRFQDAAAVPAPAEPADVPSEPGTGLDILVVEDDARVLKSVLAALGELGHRAVGCGDPADAPRAIAAMPRVDLILSDVLMPGQTGPELVQALRTDRPDLRVLFMTGFAGDLDDDALGHDSVIRKPFTLAALSHAIAAAAGG
ncbi:ATP-binding protein [Sphingomonas sp. Y38-1Y]|uniref:ATP-binding protein n=1 Tax=Sphingomonas sp. Y38-1Y TaxID=3078265 RepID=UPI0028E498C5|nr:ATP-binding protein [Sphingomonas sp. Y38-1Y]